MKRFGCILFSACLACPVSITISTVAVAAESAVVAQDLVKVTASDKVMAAMWTRRHDSYTLQVVLDRSRYVVETPPVIPRVSRSSEFPEVSIGATIANLRGLDPSFGCRTLTLVDGRRLVAEKAGAAIATTPLPKAPLAPGAPQVQVWLLRADGTQILPVWHSPKPAPVGSCSARLIADEVLFRFSVLDSPQAIAAAIMIDDEYYIEKIQPLTIESAAQ